MPLTPNERQWQRQRHGLGSAVADIERVHPAYRSYAVRFHHCGDEENSPVYRAYPEGHDHQPPGECLVLSTRFVGCHEFNAAELFS